MFNKLLIPVLIVLGGVAVWFLVINPGMETTETPASDVSLPTTPPAVPWEEGSETADPGIPAISGYGFVSEEAVVEGDYNQLITYRGEGDIPSAQEAISRWAVGEGWMLAPMESQATEGLTFQHDDFGFMRAEVYELEDGMVEILIYR
jgi:hypothetical protein